MTHWGNPRKESAVSFQLQHAGHPGLQPSEPRCRSKTGTGSDSMSSSAPAEMPAMAPELLTVIIASVSCVAFCLVILMLVLVLYRKDPLCCRFRPPSTQDYMENPPLYHSRHSLIAMAHNEHAAALHQRTMAPQLPGRLFIIGKPTDYHLEGPLPRLPSYESVRKKDRQRHVHSMIAQRFGLGGCNDEPPPTYEETFCQSLQVSSVDLQSLERSFHSHNDSLNPGENTHVVHQPSPQDPASS